MMGEYSFNITITPEVAGSLIEKRYSNHSRKLVLEVRDSAIEASMANDKGRKYLADNFNVEGTILKVGAVLSPVPTPSTEKYTHPPMGRLAVGTPTGILLGRTIPWEDLEDEVDIILSNANSNEFYYHDLGNSQYYWVRYSDIISVGPARHDSSSSTRKAR